MTDTRHLPGTVTPKDKPAPVAPQVFERDDGSVVLELDGEWTVKYVGQGSAHLRTYITVVRA